MGFKRTAEGRVFFENSYENENAGGNQNTAGSLEIAGLLRALNQRLQDAQAERARLLRELNDFRDVIQDLEERTGRGEQAYMDLEQKVALKQDESLIKAERAERAARETLGDILEARNSLSELLDKSEDGERTAAAIRKEIEETKNLIAEMRKRQAILEKLQKEQGEKMVDHVAAYVAMSKRINAAEARYITLDNKIEETSTRQTQLDRRFEKLTEDRVRFLRKIDRIEETVIQMRDTLNAKAMVVLADPGAAAALPPAQEQDREKLRAREPVVVKRKSADEEGLPWWQKSFQLQASAITLATALFIVAGLAVMIEVTPSLKEKLNPANIAALDHAKWRPLDGNKLAGGEMVQSEIVEPGKPLVVDVQKELESRAPATAPADDPAPLTESDLVNDIGAIDLNDEDQLLAALEENPDALAARLNEIEPGSETEAVTETVTAPEPQTEEPQAEAIEEIETAAVDATAEIPAQSPAPAAAPPVEEPITEEPAAADQGRSTLAERIQPDTGLPPAAKDIEVQAFSGIPEAQHDLAALYVSGYSGVEKNFERASLWFREAAENGIANAAYNLGVLYHQGLGVPRNIENAIDWYLAAAAKNHPEAQYNLGIAYIEGIGVEYDPFKASRYFENAAKAGIVEASYNLGLIYENGLLGEAQPDEALAWYKSAADKGSREAKAALEQLAKTLGIDVGEVNKLADQVKQSKAEPAPAVSQPVSLVRQPPQPAPIAPPEEVRAPSPQEETRALTAEIQTHLMRLGLYPGPADGAGGPLTVDAIRSYQALSKLDIDGRPSRELLDHMLTQSAADIELGSREQ